MLTLEEAKTDFINSKIRSARIGRKGWKARAIALAEKEWLDGGLDGFKTERYLEQVRAYEDELKRKMDEPVWRVVKQFGIYCFSGVLYGAKAVYGGGTMTGYDAVAEAEKIQNSPKCKGARAQFQDILNR